MKSMEQMQQEVDDYISQFKAGYFSPLANLARMTEEVGELAREINHHFGEKKKNFFIFQKDEIFFLKTTNILYSM